METWLVEIADAFEPEFDALHEDERTVVAALRTAIGTAKGGHAERIAPRQHEGVRAKTRFYRALIRKADQRFDAYLQGLKAKGGNDAGER